MGSKDIWIADFYAPWCPHCQAFEPELAKAALELKGKVKIGKIDSMAELELKDRFDVHSFPQIKVFDYGNDKSVSKAYNYTGNRTAEDIIKFAENLVKK